MSVTWLHVSDFHLSDKGPYNQEVILNALVSSVRRLRGEGHKPDLIFATGDIAQYGKANEYAYATKFFNDLLDAAGLEKNRLFIVPGNHDVDRKMGKGLARTLESNEDADEYFDPETPTPHLTQKLKAFTEWYNDYFKGIRTFPTDTTCSQVEVITIRNTFIAVLPLNSTLFCMDDHDYNKLVIGRRCLAIAERQLQPLVEADLKIALLHHPLEWLSSIERANIRATLGAKIDIILHGHYHETVTEGIVSASGGYLKLAAGAAWQTRQYPNCALYATFEGNHVKIFPIHYVDKPQEIWNLDNSIFPEPPYTKSFPIKGGLSFPVKLHVADAERYQATLKEELGSIRMLGLPGIKSVNVNLNDNTFVPLRLADRQESGNKEKSSLPGGEHILYPDQIMKRVFHDRRGRRMLLVIGDPGAGKTTLLQYYALCALEGDHYIRLGFAEPISVFYFPLRELLRDKAGNYDTLPENLASWYGKHHQTIATDIFSDWLNTETSLVLLDGLDEISNTTDRIQVCKWIDKAWAGFSKACFVVTSRATGYNKDEGIELEVAYDRAEVQDFTLEQQERFLRNWFTAAFLNEPTPDNFGDKEWIEHQRAVADDRTIRMVTHLNEEKNKGLRQLAAVPMILQIMAILWKDSDYMPESRVKLYEASLDYLLEIRDKQREIIPLVSAARAKLVLAPVSLWMQEKLKKDEAGQLAMHKKIQEQLDKQDKPPSAEDFCDYLVKRAGLLMKTGGHYLFRHKSFREYLAGVELASKVKSTKYVGHLITGFGKDWWDEPIRFFIALGNEKIFNLFMKKLFDSPVSADLSPKQQILLQAIIEEAPLKKVDALCTKLLDPSTTSSRQRTIIDCLKTIGKPAALETLQRFKRECLAQGNKDVTGRADEVIRFFGGQIEEREAEKPLFGTIRSILNPNEHNAEYILIPGGRYVYSVTGKEEFVADLYVAKYPVTNKLYRSFIAALGSVPELKDKMNDIAKKEKWVTGFEKYLEGTDDLATLFRSKYDEDRKFCGDDQPVVGVSWYAARAYCLWLSLLEYKGEKIDIYRLPKETEWEWAAGGKQGTVGQKVRDYPWTEEKGEPTSTLANYDSNVGATTPVGRYPEGATPEGLYDMAGNVWEWMENYWDDTEKSARSLRGGSWLDASDVLRCSARYGNLPDYRDDFIGFRVVRPGHSS